MSQVHQDEAQIGPSTKNTGAEQMKRWMAIMVIGVDVALRLGMDPKFGILWQPAYQPHPFNRDAILPAGWMLTTPSGSVQFNTPQAQAIKDPLDAIETFKAHIISHTPKPQEKPQ